MCTDIRKDISNMDVTAGPSECNYLHMGNAENTLPALLSHFSSHPGTSHGKPCVLLLIWQHPPPHPTHTPPGAMLSTFGASKRRGTLGQRRRRWSVAPPFLSQGNKASPQHRHIHLMR